MREGTARLRHDRSVDKLLHADAMVLAHCLRGLAESLMPPMFRFCNSS
jgi:hypothetical protein